MRPSRREALRLLVRLPSDRTSVRDYFAAAREEWPWASRHAVLCRLRQAIRAGEATIYQHPAAGRLVVLTPLGAQLLQVVLSWDSRTWWYRAQVDERMVPLDPDDLLEDPEDVLLVVDRSPSTIDRVLSLERGEWMVRPAACVRLLGDQGWAWRWTNATPDPRNCPFHEKVLRRLDYCLFCDRFGYEHQLEPVRSVEAFRLR